jgi:hypothetical protein
MLVLAHRGLLNNLRNPAVIWLRFAMYFMLSVMIGTIWLRLDYTAVRRAATSLRTQHNVPGSIMQNNVINISSALFFITAFMVRALFV